MSKKSIFNKLVIYDIAQDVFLSSSKNNIQRNIIERDNIWMNADDVYTFDELTKNEIPLPIFDFIDIYRSNYKRFAKNTHTDIDTLLLKKKITKRDISLLPINNNTCYQLDRLFDNLNKPDEDTSHIKFNFPLSFGEKWNKYIPYFTDENFKIPGMNKDILSPVIDESPRPFLYVIYEDYTIAIIECANKMEILSKHLNLIYITGYKNGKFKKIIVAGEIVYNYTEKTIHYNFESGSIFGNIFFKNSELFTTNICMFE
jgi:hypothetical protein